MRERAEGRISSIEPRLLAKPRLSLDLFGAPRFRLGRPLRLEAPPRTLPLLAYVVLHGPDPVSRSAVAAAVWPESSDADARTNLRRHVHALRKALAHHDVASDVLLSEGATVRLNPAIDIDIDVRDYARLASSDVTLADAVALYRGDLLETLDDEWAYAERLRLRGAQLGNLERLADLARCDGDRETAWRWLSAALAFEPWNEELATQAMTLAWECGRRHDALLVYRQFAERFRAELGAGPLPRTTSLYAAIAEGRAFRSLGFVPEDTTSFVGRSVEFRALVERMRHDRLVTLTGAPGIGKTRLALRAARFLARSFADGAFVVDVASATDAATVRASLADALDLFGPAGPRDVSLEQRMRDLRALVVLDNCEHVGEACAAVVGPLLAASPGTRVLATSHDRLNVSAERVIALGPMSAASEGPALFLERARAIDADFVVDPSQLAKVGDICALLDGLPLAIELAAVRAPAHGIAGLEALLRDRFDVLDRGYRDAPAHHRTLHSAFARSVDALAAEDRTAFLAASVFAGGFESEQLSVLLESVAPGDVGARATVSWIDRSLRWNLSRRDDTGSYIRRAPTRGVRS